MSRVATIDIGTNTVLLLIADVGAVRKPPLQVIHDEARITRLGEGLHKNPEFIETAQERVLKVLKEYRQLCDKAGVKKIIAVGTAGFRKAKNAGAFVGRVEKETGIKIRIISGKEEARLSYLSVERDFGNFQNLYALDIGGGSTEIIGKNGGVSLDLGGVVLTERIIRHDPPIESEVALMMEAIEEKLQNVGAQFIAPVRGLINQTPTLVALAGSVTTLSAIQQKLAVWDGARVQGSVLSLKDIEEMTKLFRRTTNEERRTIVGMVKGREDTILSGTLILKKVMEHLGVQKVIVSDRGLRYGLLYK